MAEIIAPCERAQRVTVQDVFTGEADRAVDLMRNRGALFGGFSTTDFCRRRLKKYCVIE